MDSNRQKHGEEGFLFENDGLSIPWGKDLLVQDLYLTFTVEIELAYTECYKKVKL